MRGSYLLLSFHFFLLLYECFFFLSSEPLLSRLPDLVLHVLVILHDSHRGQHVSTMHTTVIHWAIPPIFFATLIHTPGKVFSIDFQRTPNPLVMKLQCILNDQRRKSPSTNARYIRYITPKQPKNPRYTQPDVHEQKKSLSVRKRLSHITWPYHLFNPQFTP